MLKSLANAADPKVNNDSSSEEVANLLPRILRWLMFHSNIRKHHRRNKNLGYQKGVKYDFVIVIVLLEQL